MIIQFITPLIQGAYVLQLLIMEESFIVPIHVWDATEYFHYESSISPVKEGIPCIAILSF